MDAPPFPRTTCACSGCVACCKRQPGPLVPGDFERIRDFLGTTDAEMKRLVWASPGAVVKDTAGNVKRVGTITPRWDRRTKRCVFLDDNDRCKIHPVAPAGCAYFDTHQGPVEGHSRSVWVVRQQLDPDYQKLRDELDYASYHKPLGFLRMTDLTTAQRAAVETAARNVLVVGSAGSRKTATLVARLRWLRDRGESMKKVAVITYTNAAARVIVERLERESGFTFGGYCGTLHGFCLRHLRRFAYPTVELRVIDDNERDARLLAAADESGVKATLKQLLGYKRKTLTGELRYGTPLHTAVSKYHTDNLFEGLLDYEMILGMTETNLSRSDADRWRWAHLLVDEYQDISRTDAMIFERTAADNRYYVGDPMQAIFGFRGGSVAEFRRLLDDSAFEKHYLMENWRSTPEICEAATRLAVKAGGGAVEKALVSMREPGPAPGSREYPNAAQEAHSIATSIMERVVNEEPPDGFAVLARTNEIANQIAGMLAHVGLPVRMLIEYMRPPDWARALAALGVLARPKSVPALLRWARLNDRTFNGFIGATIRGGDELKTFAVRTAIPITGDADKMPDELRALGISLQSIAIISERFEELSTSADLADLELELTLAGPGRTIDGKGVFVGTIHGAKGMEFDTVIMAGCEDETIPGLGRNRNEAEERRVFYVGMTRAKRRLIFTWARSRSFAYGGSDRDRNASRFIAEALQ